MAAATQRVHYVAGASGTGTSTRAMRLQQQWTTCDDARPVLVVATDVVRAQLRTLAVQVDTPELFGESFNLTPSGADDLVVDGVAIGAFLRQCAPILRAVEAGVEYALTEGWDVIVEGVHLVPGAYAPTTTDDVLVAAELLVVDDPDEHVSRFVARDATSAGRRPAAHYEANLARVRAVQAELIDRWHASEPGSGLDR